jgi:hypothetical protein
LEITGIKFLKYFTFSCLILYIAKSVKFLICAAYVYSRRSWHILRYNSDSFLNKLRKITKTPSLLEHPLPEYDILYSVNGITFVWLRDVEYTINP